MPAYRLLEAVVATLESEVLRVRYAGLVYASLVASQARELLLQGGVAPPASRLAARPRPLGSSTQLLHALRGESAFTN